MECTPIQQDKKHNARVNRAIWGSILLFFLQLWAGYYVWDADGLTFRVFTTLLSVVQFPVFLLVDVASSHSNDGVTGFVCEWIFHTYLIKFYAVSLAYSILSWHWLIGRRWRWYKYVLFLFAEILFLMITALDWEVGSSRELRWAPIEIVFTPWLYHIVNKYV